MAGIDERGWIKLSRGIRDNFLWNFDSPKYALAWIDIIMMANWEDKIIVFNGKSKTVKRGSFITSTVKLAERWNMSRNTVKSFLDTLKKEGMITYQSTNRCTTVFVTNYVAYQGFEDAEDREDCATERATEGATERATEGATEGATERATEGATERAQRRNQKKSKKSKNSKKGEASGDKRPPAPISTDYSKTSFSEPMKAKVNDWLKYKQERREEYKPTGLQSLITQIQNNVNQHGEAAVMGLIDECMASNYRGILFDRLGKAVGDRGKPAPTKAEPAAEPDTAWMKKYIDQRDKGRKKPADDP